MTYNVNPHEAKKMKKTFIIIHSLIKEKEAFLSWWNMKDYEDED